MAEQDTGGGSQDILLLEGGGGGGTHSSSNRMDWGGGGTAGTLFLLYVCSVCSMKYVLMYVCSIGQNRGHYRLLSLAFSTSAPVRPSRPEMPAGWMDGWMDGWTAAEMAVD